MVAANNLENLSPALVSAVTRHAEFSADLTAACLDALNPRIRAAGFPDGCNGLPGAFLQEFSAVALLKYWEIQGIASLLPPDVPCYAEASRDLASRAATDPQQFWNADVAPLSQQIMQVWIENFHWLEPNLVEAQVVIGQADEDKIIEVIAQLLMANRHLTETSNDTEPNEQ